MKKKKKIRGGSFLHADWKCSVCSELNAPDAKTCYVCESPSCLPPPPQPQPTQPPPQPTELAADLQNMIASGWAGPHHV